MGSCETSVRADVDQTWVPVLVQPDAEVSSSSGSEFLPLVFV